MPGALGLCTPLQPGQALGIPTASGSLVGSFVRDKGAPSPSGSPEPPEEQGKEFCLTGAPPAAENGARGGMETCESLTFGEGGEVSLGTEP